MIIERSGEGATEWKITAFITHVNRDGNPDSVGSSWSGRTSRFVQSKRFKVGSEESITIELPDLFALTSFSH
jgi:hypothetical protein